MHLRDALDLVSKKAPDLLLRFGGHAAAAGLTIREENLPRFRDLFEEVVQDLIPPAALTRTVQTDGPLEGGYYSLETARLLDQDIWGQGFPAPVFSDDFRIEHKRLLKDKHLKLTLSQDQSRYDAIRFNHADQAPARIHAAFRLAENEYNGVCSVQLMLEDFESL